MNIHVIIQVKKIQEFYVIQFYLNHLQFSNVSTDTTVILKEKMLNEKSTKPFNILHQSNLRKSHATRLKSMNKIPFI